MPPPTRTTAFEQPAQAAKFPAEIAASLPKAAQVSAINECLIRFLHFIELMGRLLLLFAGSEVADHDDVIAAGTAHDGESIAIGCPRKAEDSACREVGYFPRWPASNCLVP